jgi:hypothetical protein
MGKEFWLTWKTDDGEVITEIVEKVSPVDPVYAGGVPVGMSVSLFERPGHTLFEDAEGLFDLPNERIIKLEEVI